MFCWKRNFCARGNKLCDSSLKSYTTKSFKTSDNAIYWMERVLHSLAAWKGNIAWSNWLYDARVLRQMDTRTHILYYTTLQPTLQSTTVSAIKLNQPWSNLWWLLKGQDKKILWKKNLYYTSYQSLQLLQITANKFYNNYKTLRQYFSSN